MNEARPRTQMVREQMKQVSLESEFARYEEQNRIHKMLMECFRDTEHMDKLNEIEEIFRKKSSKKILYLDSLKRFGKKNGVYIYNCMKGLVV